jgi:hypothetical protein
MVRIHKMLKMCGKDPPSDKIETQLEAFLSNLVSHKLVVSH